MTNEGAEQVQKILDSARGRILTLEKDLDEERQSRIHLENVILSLVYSINAMQEIVQEIDKRRVRKGE